MISGRKRLDFVLDNSCPSPYPENMNPRELPDDLHVFAEENLIVYGDTYLYVNEREDYPRLPSHLENMNIHALPDDLHVLAEANLIAYGDSYLYIDERGDYQVRDLQAQEPNVISRVNFPWKARAERRHRTARARSRKHRICLNLGKARVVEHRWEQKQ